MTQNTKPMSIIPAADAELITKFARDAANLAVAVTIASNYVASDLDTRRIIDATLANIRSTYNTTRELLLDRVGRDNEALVDKLNARARAYEIIRVHAREHNASMPTADFLDVSTKLLADMNAVAAIIADQTRS